MCGYCYGFAITVKNEDSTPYVAFYQRAMLKKLQCVAFMK